MENDNNENQITEDVTKHGSFNADDIASHQSSNNR